MKKFTFYACLLMIGFNSMTSFAQEESSFGAFIASPTGDFKSTSLTNGGFAKSGWGLVFDSKNKIGFLPQGWSYYFHSTYQWNEMDTQAVGQKFTEVLGYRTTVSDSKYSPLLTTIGPVYDFSLGEKVKLGVKGGIGVIFSNTKAFTVTIYDANNNVLANELVNFDNNVAFAYNLGIDLNFQIVKDVVGITLFSDYTSANQSTELTFTKGDPQDSFQKLQYLNTGFKLVLMKKKV